MFRKSSLVSILIAVPVLVAAPGIRTAHARTSETPLVRIEATSTIAAKPDAVWKWMTQGKNLVTWCPVWKSDANQKVDLKKVGDTLDFTDQWGNGGRSIVTFLAEKKELRVAHEPADGSYLCQSRVILTPAGSGTNVKWVEQYSDASVPADKAATATKMEADIAANLNTLKAAIEKK
ncbi:MAG: SRPBCC family protein [Candidatus Eisenbacteria bacterium]|nr:SRPBCC family protein [Candidatus Eisenbacteria bacterium]